MIENFKTLWKISGVEKRNGKNGKFSETKRNGTERKKITKSRNETKRNGKSQETKRNVTILFRNEKTKRKEKNNVSSKNQRFINNFVCNFYAAFSTCKKNISFWERNLCFFK
jgi:hypothetical protein